MSGTSSKGKQCWTNWFLLFQSLKPQSSNAATQFNRGAGESLAVQSLIEVSAQSPHSIQNPKSRYIIYILWKGWSSVSISNHSWMWFDPLYDKIGESSMSSSSHFGVPSTSSTCRSLIGSICIVDERLEVVLLIWCYQRCPHQCYHHLWMSSLLSTQHQHNTLWCHHFPCVCNHLSHSCTFFITTAASYLCGL